MKLNKFKQKIKAFTLVELVVVIAIIIILSSVSIPIYKGYIKNAKRAEGYLLLSTIKKAEQNYYAEYRNFIYSNGWTCNTPILSVDARTNKYFTLFTIGGGSVYISYNVYVRNSDVGDITLCFNLTSGEKYYIC